MKSASKVSNTNNIHPAHVPHLLVSDPEGSMFEIPELLMAGMEGLEPVLPDREDIVELPYGSDLFLLPDRVPVGYDPEEEEFVLLPEYDGTPVFPVATFMAPAHMQILLPGYEEREHAVPLPLYSYTAAGWSDGKTFAAGIRIDSDIRQDLAYVDFGEIEARAPEVISRYEGNRLVRHLVENCALCYGCPAARNFVLGRWECPVPTSRQCNAACVGCISAQPAGTGVRPAQDRIAFVPTADEIVQFTVPHLEEADDPVVSFGQGCEGEPLLYCGLLEEAIRGIRRRTPKGVINLNTNGSLPDAVERLCTAGLDSIRISLNSAQKELYNRYYRQRSYAFEDVLESVRTAGERNVWVSLNYFIFPGLTDSPEETASLFRLLEEGNIDMIQTRNINIDPYMYLRILGSERVPGSGAGAEGGPAGGMRAWLGEVRRRFPHIRLGYFNPGCEVIASARG